MPRRSTLSAAERENLLAFPTAEDDLIRHYTLSEPDLSVVRQHRLGQNRLGFAIQLCYLRYPGIALPTGRSPPDPLLSIVAQQLRLDPALWLQSLVSGYKSNRINWLPASGKSFSESDA